MTKQQAICVPVQLDGSIFHRFAIFDTYVRQKRWRMPALFAVMMAFFAIICYSRYETDGAVLLGTVLLVVGIGLPLVWCINYELSLRKEIKKLHLETPQRAYTLLFSPDGIEVSRDRGKTFSPIAWGSIVHVYRHSGCTYLYIDASHAYLLPHSQVEGGEDKLWALMQASLPAEKLSDSTSKQH